MLAQHVPRQACRRVLAPSLPLLSPSENCRWGKDNSIRLQARSKSQPDPHRPKHSRGLCRLLVGNTRCPSLARLLLFGLRDTCPSNKADKPRDLSRTTCSNASFLRLSAEPADFQIQQLRSPAGLTLSRPVYGCTVRPKAVCPRVRPRVRRLRRGRRPAERLSPRPTPPRQAPFPPSAARCHAACNGKPTCAR